MLLGEGLNQPLTVVKDEVRPKDMLFTELVARW
jgi:hypothetical protein